MSSGSSTSSGSGNFAYDSNDSDFRTHYPVYGQSDYSSDGTNSIGSYGLWSDNYSGASTDSGHSQTSDTSSNWSYNSGSSATSYGSASTWGSTIGRGSTDGYDGDTESICQ